MRIRKILMMLAMAVAYVALPLQGQTDPPKKDTKTSGGTDAHARTPMDPAHKTPTKDAGAGPAQTANAAQPENKRTNDIKMPFGKHPDDEQKAPPAADGPHWKVKDLGDSVRFEYSTPMGPNVWIKKKSELNEQEKLALSNATPPPDTPKNASSASGK